MSYLVLARKYRPQTFEEVVGQSHVTTTLANAITAGRVAHAILFSGPRGTGKTTVARILAKTINCEQNRKTPGPIPCNTCRSCTEITSGSAVDVFEIDGASNNSVDQIRELRDNVRYMPAHSSYKIYIIDEVHMLSIAAFNALLKTLEEPPDHVKFMFATTEPKKIPITIMSRCQCHDMRRIDLDEIVKYITFLCEQENVEIEAKSLALIAQESGGSMRDALSLLDQVISCSMGSINHDQVLGILGTVDRQNLFDLSGAILTQNPDRILGLIKEIYDLGQDLKKFYGEITAHFRNLMVAKMTKQSNQLIDLPEHEIELMKEQTANIPAPYLSQLMAVLFAEEAAVRFSSHPKIAVEIALLKLVQIKPALSIETLIEKLDLLQKQIEVSQPEHTEKNTVSKGKNAYLNPNKAGHQASVSESPSTFTGDNPVQQQEKDNFQNLPPVQPARSSLEAHTGAQGERPSNYNPADAIEISWNKFRNWLAGIHPPLAPNLSSSRLKNLSEERIDIEVSGSNFNIQRVLNDKNKALLEKALKRFFRTDAGITIAADYQQAETTKKKKEQTNQLKLDALKNPVVNEAVNIFNGHVETKIL